MPSRIAASGRVPSVVPVPTNGLQLWVSAAYGVVPGAGSSVKQLFDLSGNGNDLYQPTAVNQPTLGTWPNGRPMLSSGTNTQMHTLLPSVAIGNFEIVCIFKCTSQSYLYVHGSDAGGANPGVALWTSTGNTVYVNKGNAATLDQRNAGVGWGSDGNPHLVHHSYNGTNATDFILLDNVAQTMADVVAHDPGSAVVSSVFNLFGNSSAANGLIGGLAECAIYNRVLTSVERGQWHSYSQALWGTP